MRDEKIDRAIEERMKRNLGKRVRISHLKEGDPVLRPGMEGTIVDIQPANSYIDEGPRYTVQFDNGYQLHLNDGDEYSFID